MASAHARVFLLPLRARLDPTHPVFVEIPSHPWYSLDARGPPSPRCHCPRSHQPTPHETTLPPPFLPPSLPPPSQLPLTYSTKCSLPPATSPREWPQHPWSSRACVAWPKDLVRSLKHTIVGKKNHNSELTIVFKYAINYSKEIGSNHREHNWLL